MESINAFETWLKRRTHNGRKLAVLTVSSHVQTVRTLGAWYESTYSEALNPSMLTNFDVLAFRNWSINIQRVAAATWNVRRAGLAALAEWMGDAHLMDGVAIQESGETAIRWLDDSEYGKMVRTLERLPKQAVTALEHQRAIRDRAMTSLMLFAGLRVSEVTNLRRGDVEIGERSGHVLVRNGKGGKARKVPLGLAARRALAPWLEACADDVIFNVTNRTVQRAVSEIGAQAGIAGLSCHDLRHTCAKRTLDGKNASDGAPVQIGVVKNLLGHARLETTLRYVAPSWADMESALGGM
jgi:integrase/recombinase XerD